MGYSTSKFVLNRNMDNEFIITIKQTGTTLPMEIVANETTRYISMTPEVIYVPYQAEVAYVPYQAAVTEEIIGQEFIPAIEGKKEVYQITVGYLTDGEAYELAINGTVVPVPYSTTTYSDEYEYLEALASDIKTNSGINTIVDAEVDSNKLVITGKTEGISYTVNGSDEFAIYEIQKAVTPVAGQAYVEAVPISDGIEEVPYQAAIPAHYVASNTAVSVELAELLDDLSGITKIEIQPEVIVGKVEVGNTEITMINGWYDIGTSTALNVTPAEVEGMLDEPLDDVELKVRVTLSDTVDTFSAKLINLSDGNTVLDIPFQTTENTTRVELTDELLTGKIRIIVVEADVNTLTRSVGPEEDRYYLKPSYKLVLECDTLNNGKFIAKIPEVYVE